MKGEEVSIVKMDATANDVPSTYDVKGFPTLFWIKKDSKDKPIRYEVSWITLNLWKTFFLTRLKIISYLLCTMHRLYCD
jgi:hypothetical protein